MRYQDQFTNWNETSRRYTTEKLAFYMPDVFYSRSEDAKQGSGPPLQPEEQEEMKAFLSEVYEYCTNKYFEAIEEKRLCVEQARLMLPAYGLYVRWRWTCSLQTLCHFISQRIEHGAQKGINNYAKAVYILTNELFSMGMDNMLKPDIKELIKQTRI